MNDILLVIPLYRILYTEPTTYIQKKITLFALHYVIYMLRYSYKTEQNNNYARNVNQIQYLGCVRGKRYCYNIAVQTAVVTPSCFTISQKVTGVLYLTNEV